MDMRAILMGVVFALIWSSAFSSARIIVADASPLAALSLRFALAGMLGIIIARARGETWRLGPGQLRAIIIFGFCQNSLYLGLNFIAMQKIEASLAAIIASTMPLLVALAGRIFLRESLRPLALIGLIAGMMGVVLIMAGRIRAGVDIPGVLLAAGGTLALAAATLLVRSASGAGNLLMVVGLQMLVGAFTLGIASLLSENWFFRPGWALVAAFTYTTLVPGLVATWIWFALVGRIGATRAATFHFLNPFFGVLIAAAVLGEAIHPRDLLGAAIIALGILAVQLSRQREA